MKYIYCINRMAVVVKRKQSFIDWVKAQEGNLDVPVEKHDDKSVYLLAERDGADWEKYVKKHFQEIFENELEGWMTDQSTWPIDRSWGVFTEWLDFEVQTMVYDLVDQPIEKD